ncbi:Lsr2 family protein [Saccharopolyspora sp. NFXS83]|uniref:histone-like nucleoid-structuring protein Lsr2 n=1 Tax=Saccharopolyspora sp. NFXS83 TaxID=2993560 RepID=UPI00224B42E2|nr:Lsr2 family protein [Saccharopolyspora sp. NFXS83]MCX2734402.1 Lsr2 family protein [Saccharopolyspora sp. NFXS83]
MAERIQVELVDDIDGSPAQQTVTFALDGVTYEIDLSERHAQRLRGVFARYIERARAPEREQTATAAKRQERDERDARQANRQLTEQIRGAAQRSKDRVSKQQDPEPAAESAPEEPASPVDHPVLEPTISDQRSETLEDRQDSAVPSVSLPQFSSAVD